MIDWFVIITLLGLGISISKALGFSAAFAITLLVATGVQILVNYIRKKSTMSINEFIKKINNANQEPINMNSVKEKKKGNTSTYDYSSKGQVPVRINDIGGYYISVIEVAKALEKFYKELEYKQVEEEIKKLLDKQIEKEKDKNGK